MTETSKQTVSAIRRAQDKDIPMIMELLHEVLEVHAAIRPDLFISGTTKYSVPDLQAVLADDKTPVFVAVNNQDEAMGHCFCVLQEHPKTNNSNAYSTIYIDDLCVSEKFRGAGVAKALYQHVLEYAKSLGCHNVTLHVWEGNDRARAFYEKMGMGVQSTTMEQVLR